MFGEITKAKVVINPDSINNMAPEDIRELIKNLQDQKFELEMQNEKLKLHN